MEMLKLMPHSFRSILTHLALEVTKEPRKVKVQITNLKEKEEVSVSTHLISCL
jgi:hypothetical protein